MIDLLVDILHFPWTTYLVVFTISSLCTYVIVSAIKHERKERNRLRRSASAVSSEHNTLQNFPFKAPRLWWGNESSLDDTVPDWYWYDGQTEPDERVSDWRTESP